MFPLKIDKFENIKLPVPNNSDDFCSRAFGKNYMDVFYINQPHYDSFLYDFNDIFGIYSVNNIKFYIKDLINGE